jgi:hypothetical protein
LTTPVDDRLDLKADNEVPLTAVALLCAGCYHSTSQRNQIIPIYSIKAGVDYTLQHIYLPPLSKLGVLMLSRYMPYGNIFQLATGRGAIAVKGSWVLMKTEVGSIVANLQKQHTDFLLHQEENQDSILFPRNPRDSGFKIMFTGPMDRWNRLIGEPGSETRILFRSLYQQHLTLTWDLLFLYIQFPRKKSNFR